MHIYIYVYVVGATAVGVVAGLVGNEVLLSVLREVQVLVWGVDYNFANYTIDNDLSYGDSTIYFEYCLTN